MSGRGTAHLLVGLTIAALVATTGCSPSDDGSDADDRPSTTPTAEAAPSPPPAPPTVGSCYRISHEEAVAPTNEDPPVPCDQVHTSQTFSVGTLDLVVAGHLVAVDSDTVRRQVSRRCPRRLAAYVGATPEQLRLTLLRPVWFTPTLEQSDAGAAWYRCDVIAVTGDSKIAKLDSDISGALGTPSGRTEYGMCGTAPPAAPTFSHVLCREDHSWRAISVVDLAQESRNGGYPGEAAVRGAGETVCDDAAREIAEDALDYEWGYEWPTRDQWRAGQTYGRCWAPDPAQDIA